MRGIEEDRVAHHELLAADLERLELHVEVERLQHYPVVARHQEFQALSYDIK